MGQQKPNLLWKKYTWGWKFLFIWYTFFLFQSEWLHMSTFNNNLSFREFEICLKLFVINGYYSLWDVLWFCRQVTNWNVRDWGTWISHLNTGALSKYSASAGMLEITSEWVSSLCFLPVPLQSQLEAVILIDANEAYHVFTGLHQIWDYSSLNV